MINRYQTLWLGGGPKVSIPVSQYDTMWRFVFTVINGSVEWEIPSGATAILNGRKPDGNVIAISGTIADNKVTVDATEQMTVVAGEVVCELSIMSGGAVVGTANFTLAVEDAPKKDGEPISESDLSAYAEMIAAAGELVEEAQEIIEQGPFLPPGGTPGQVLTKTATGETWDDVSGLPDGGSNGQVLTKTSDGAEWSDAGTPTQAQTDSAVADWLDEHPEATTTVQDGSITEQKLDPYLTAKVNGGGISNAVKVALLALLEKVAYIDEDGQTYLDALEDALYPPANLVSITAVFDQGSNVIYDTDSLDTLKQYLTVTANYDNSTSATVTGYLLSGTLTVGTSTITVIYDGKSTTISVTVAEAVPAEYTRYDYIEQTNALAMSAVTNMIFLKNYDNLNRVSIQVPVRTTAVGTGYAIMGGRPTSGAAKSFAFYSSPGGESGTLGFHLHGNDTGISIPFSSGEKHNISYTATTTSPSTIDVDGTEYEIAWSNDNTINAKLALFANPPGNASTNLSPNVQIGRISVFDVGGNLINNYIPCVRSADNVIGMYDMVEEIFYTAETTSVATIGDNACRYKVGNWA